MSTYIMVSEAARLLGMSEAGVRKMANQGRLRVAMMISGKRVFAKTDLDAVLADRNASREEREEREEGPRDTRHGPKKRR